jgi:hypothetical protein
LSPEIENTFMTMTTPLPARLELRQRLFQLPRTQRWLIWATAVMLLALVVGLAAITLSALPEEKRSGEVLLEGLLAKITRNPLDAVLNLVMLIALTLQVVYMRLAHRHERLILTSGGIEYRSPLPWVLQPLRPSWSLAWGQIRTATLQGTKLVRGPQALALELESGMRKVKIIPFQWVDPKNYQPLSPWADFLKQKNANAVDNVAWVEESEVLRYMAVAAPQLAVKHLPQGAGFALEKNRQALVVVVGFFVLLFYALGDSFFSGYEVYADEPPYSFFVASGLLSALMAGLWMRRGKVPVAENVFVSLLFGAALGAAAYPAALRVNAFTDQDGLRRYAYQLTPALTLKPLTDGLPVLAFPRYPEYWSQFKRGSIHDFELRCGGLAFYQLNMQPVNLAMREFYEKQNNKR